MGKKGHWCEERTLELGGGERVVLRRAVEGGPVYIGLEGDGLAGPPSMVTLEDDQRLALVDLLSERSDD